MRRAIRNAPRPFFGALLILTALLSWTSAFSIPYSFLTEIGPRGTAFVLEMLGLFVVLQALNCVILFAGIYLLVKRSTA